MLDIERLLTIAALLKFLQAEPMSRTDMERILTVLETSDFRMEILDQPTVAGIQVRLRDVLRRRFLPPEG